MKMQKPIAIPRKLEGGIALAQWKGLETYIPKISDFIIWHGWWYRWYGIITDINNGNLSILRENLPKLLFTTPEDERDKNTIKISITKIRSSRGGEYHVLQDGVWYVDN
jgi:hypothetical protein